MHSELGNLKSGELRLLFTILEKLSRSHEQAVFRKDISEDLLCLLKADFLASFIWNPDRHVFEDVVMANMDPANIRRYERYYQFRDPITSLLQKRRRATLVCEVMPQKELEKTEFFNDFLMKDGLHHGINLYAYDSDLNIGDLRIWRSKNKPSFGNREATILDFILPYFRNALRNARSITAVKKTANLWHNLLENSENGLFLFDHNSRLVYRNNKAHDIEEKLSENERASFYGQIHSMAKNDLSRTEWGPYFLSSLCILSPHDSRPFTAVLVHRFNVAEIDAQLLQKKHKLSPREAEICLLVCKGLIDHEIASVLGIAFSTVRTHLKHIFIKLDVTTRSELIHGLLEGIVDFSF